MKVYSRRARKSVPLLLAALPLVGCADLPTSPVATEAAHSTSTALEDRVLDTFDSGSYSPWHAWTESGSSIGLRTVSPGAGGSGYAMRVSYSAYSTALVQREFGSPQDWSGYDAFEFQFHGRGTGNTIRLEIKDNGTASHTAELFEYLIVDDFEGWRTFRLSWDDFARRGDWQPAGAPDDGFGRTRVWGYRFNPLWGSGSFSVDQIRLAVAPPPVEPATEQSAGGCPVAGALRVVDVSGASALRAALEGARPGDVIRMADGVYRGTFGAYVSGTETRRIALCGSPAAVLRGDSYTSGYGFHLDASYWTLHGFTVTNSQSGVAVMSGSHNVLDALTVEGTGHEGVRFQVFSSHNVIRNSRIRNTGLQVAEYGEGVYVGSWRGHWADKTGGRPDTSDGNRIVDNVFGPDVRSEHIDVKEGTTGGLISGNTFIGAGMVRSQPWVDSWVELKGNGYTVRGNRGVGTITDGFQVYVELEGWGEGNVFSGNTADLGGAPGYAIRVSSPAPGNVVHCDNSVVDAGAGLTNVACR